MILSYDFTKIESFDFDFKIFKSELNDFVAEDFRKIESFDSDFIFKDFKK